MSFWNSRHLKARKQHICIYCNKAILPGETYWRETGTFDGDFNDYCLDEVCKVAVHKFVENGEELGNLFESLTAQGIVECPDCKSDYVSFKRRENGTHKYHCTCNRCDREWEIEITEEMINEVVK